MASPPAPRSGGLPLVLGQACLWALLLLVPLVFVPMARDSFRLPKLMLAETLGLASLFFLSFLLWSVRRIELWRHSALLAVAPLVTVATLTLFTTSSTPHSREAMIALWIGAACLVGWAAALSARQLERCLLLLVVPGGLLALLGALQLYGVYQPFGFEGDARGRMGVGSLAGNVGDLGAFLVLPALVAQWGAWKSRGKRRWLFALGAALMVFGIAVTQTLAAVAGLLLGSALLWGLMTPGRHLLRAAAAALAIASVSLALVEPLRARISEKSAQLARGHFDAVLTGRLDGWKTAGWMLRQQPLLGVGHGAYVSQFVPAKLALQEQGVSFFPGQPFPVFANPHNEVLEVAAEMGLLGLAALTWGGVALIRRLRRLPYPRAPGGSDASLAWAGLAALLAIALVHFPFRLALTGYPALIFLAWIFRRAAEEEAPP